MDPQAEIAGPVTRSWTELVAPGHVFLYSISKSILRMEYGV